VKVYISADIEGVTGASHWDETEKMKPDYQEFREEAASLIPDIAAVAVKQGTGNATINIHPRAAVEKIREGVQAAFQNDVSKCRLSMPEEFTVDISYREHSMAMKASFFPGAVSTQPHTIRFVSNDYFEVLRLFAFVL
jgi:D-amino peptidase